MGQTAVAQPPQEPKKKRGALKVVLIVVAAFVALLVLLGACVAAISGDDTAAPPAPNESTTTEPNTDDSQPPAEKTYKMGEKATDDDYQFTVTKIKCGVSRVGDSYSNEKAQGQFCLVSMRIKNVGNDPITFSSENQALVDTKGQELLTSSYGKRVMLRSLRRLGWVTVTSSRWRMGRRSILATSPESFRRFGCRVSRCLR